MANGNLGRRMIALALALVMCFGLLSVASYAAEKEDLSKLKSVYYDRAGGYYYVNAQVYLLYQNTIPSNIQQGFNIELFGPSGNNAPYITVKVNLSKLMENEGIKIKKTTAWGNFPAWYISYQTSTGYSAEALWNCILDAMDARGKAFFADYFKNNYIGYVLKVENEESHIDGIYKVDPAYFTEIYINGNLEQTFIGTSAHSFTQDVLGWFEDNYPGITWNEAKTEGQFQRDGKTYLITLEESNRFDPVSGKISYVEKTNDFFVAAFYYEITEKPVPPTEPEITEPEVTEPEVTEPEITEPEVTEPEVTEPEITEPEVTEPEITEPEVTEPEITEPEVTEPEITEPEITEPEVTEPEVTEPETTEPEITEPEVTEPEVTEPEITEPEVTEPEITEPEVTEPEVTEPEVTEPEVTEPEITEPEVTEPEVTEPEITEPEVTKPKPTEPKPTEPEEVIEIVTRPPTVPRPRPSEPAISEEIPQYDVIHEYYTDSELDGSVPGGKVHVDKPVEEIGKKPVYDGKDYVYVRAELDLENNAVILIYHREIEVVQIPDEDVPLANLPDENVPVTPSSGGGLVDIPDEDVPLAANPKTGDPIALYALTTLLSGLGLAAVCFQKKKD